MPRPRSGDRVHESRRHRPLGARPGQLVGEAAAAEGQRPHQGGGAVRVRRLGVEAAHQHRPVAIGPLAVVRLPEQVVAGGRRVDDHLVPALGQRVGRRAAQGLRAPRDLLAVPLDDERQPH